jgi:hypothetical protein
VITRITNHSQSSDETSVTLFQAYAEDLQNANLWDSVDSTQKCVMWDILQELIEIQQSLPLETTSCYPMQGVQNNFATVSNYA